MRVAATPFQILCILMALGWMGLIFFLSHQPSLPTPSLFPHQDKLFHAVTYGVLGLLLQGGLPDTPGRWLLAWLMASLYGCSDEIHQLFVPGRSADLLDLLADSAGALLGARGAMMFSRTRQWRLQDCGKTSE